MSDIQAPAETGKQFTGKHMAFVMCAFFGTIIAVNVLMAVIAGRSWTGLVVKNSYVASQEYNVRLDAARAQAERGWKSGVAYENGTLSLRLQDKAGQPIPNAEVELDYGRPAFEQADRVIVIAADGDGYSVPLQLDQGLWAMTIVARTGGVDYRRDLRLYVSEDGTGKLQ